LPELELPKPESEPKPEPELEPKPELLPKLEPEELPKLLELDPKPLEPVALPEVPLLPGVALLAPLRLLLPPPSREAAAMA
jgi:hypothetical protein